VKALPDSSTALQKAAVAQDMALTNERLAGASEFGVHVDQPLNEGSMSPLAIHFPDE